MANAAPMIGNRGWCGDRFLRISRIRRSRVFGSLRVCRGRGMSVLGMRGIFMCIHCTVLHGQSNSLELGSVYMKTRPEKELITFRFTKLVGSTPSLILHTLVFAGFFALVILDILALETMLLILTTLVSLEAIYLAIFIQMTRNTNGATRHRLKVLISLRNTCGGSWKTSRQ